MLNSSKSETIFSLEYLKLPVSLNFPIDCSELGIYNPNISGNVLEISELTELNSVKSTVKSYLDLSNGFFISNAAKIFVLSFLSSNSFKNILFKSPSNFTLKLNEFLADPSIKSDDVICDLLVISPSNFNNSKLLKFLTRIFPSKNEFFKAMDKSFNFILLSSMLTLALIFLNF